MYDLMPLGVRPIAQVGRLLLRRVHEVVVQEQAERVSLLIEGLVLVDATSPDEEHVEARGSSARHM